jgi:hypothetical protein
MKMTISDDQNDREDGLPDTTAWRPREQASTKLGTAFSKRCLVGEEHLRRILAHERDLAVDAFDSGIPFESAVREEIGRLIPRRYEVKDGTVVDRNGLSAGQVDVIVFNHMWLTTVNAPIADHAARLLVPIEGIYAIGEVKQRLTKKTLDSAMEKLVTCHRLHRPRTYANRIVENREGSSCPHGLTNPLFSFILAGEADDGEFEPLINRFFDINRQLRRLEVVRCLCVLGSGAVTWAFSDPLREGEIRLALFMRDDLFHPIMPAYARVTAAPPFYFLMQMLHLHLFDSVLGPEDVATAYGIRYEQALAFPKDPSVALAPDEEWLDMLSTPCTNGHGSNDA